MRNILAIILAIILLTITSVSFAARVSDDTVDDFQVWVPININVKIDEHWRGFFGITTTFHK